MTSIGACLKVVLLLSFYFHQHSLNNAFEYYRGCLSGNVACRHAFAATLSCHYVLGIYNDYKGFYCILLKISKRKRKNKTPIGISSTGVKKVAEDEASKVSESFQNPPMPDISSFVAISDLDIHWQNLGYLSKETLLKNIFESEKDEKEIYVFSTVMKNGTYIVVVPLGTNMYHHGTSEI
ncbi:hypothetical protein EDC96DRAFT_550382 [Choanephora cucurbitarum]|nr:hypothetical protein EDC96DRAFT_550382 [Choanephora cucurbitarum]